MPSKTTFVDFLRSQSEIVNKRLDRLVSTWTGKDWLHDKAFRYRWSRYLFENAMKHCGFFVDVLVPTAISNSRLVPEQFERAVGPRTEDSIALARLGREILGPKKQPAAEDEWIKLAGKLTGPQWRAHISWSFREAEREGVKHMMGKGLNAKYAANVEEKAFDLCLVSEDEFVTAMNELVAEPVPLSA